MQRILCNLPDLPPCIASARNHFLAEVAISLLITFLQMIDILLKIGKIILITLYFMT